MARTVETPIRIGPVTIRNRLYRAPVLEGAGSGPDAAERYASAFVPNAEAGVGLIIQGSSCVAEEGRTSPGMTLVHERERVLALVPMVDAVHRAGAAIFLQLGHGGLFAMEAWHEPHASRRRGPLLAPSPPPLLVRAALRRVPVKVLSADDIAELARQFGRSAGWAREAGYDGVQLGSANAKLLDQFLSPFYNRRTDEFGGSVEARGRILRLIRQEVSIHAGADYPCTVKIPVEKSPPGRPRVTLDDALRLCRLAEEWGFDGITPVEVSVLPDTTLSRGGIPTTLWSNPAVAKRLSVAAPRRSTRLALKAGYVIGGLTAPFRPVWNRSFFTAASARASIPVSAVGGIRTADEVDEILDKGQADLVGIGRPFYAEPDLAARILGAGAGPGRCLNSNLCVPPQMLGMKGVCYNPAVRRGGGSAGG